MNIDLTKSKSTTPSDAFLNMLNITEKKTDNTPQNIPIEQLVPFPESKTFHKYSDEKLKDLSDNIREYGILSPIIVRPLKTGNYQILAGHNRTEAAKLAGLSSVPCIIKETDDTTAKVIFVATNLNQREKLLPSEKAFAYKMLMDSGKCQYGTADEFARQGNESRRQIFRYIRLTYLIEPLLNMIDCGELVFMAGVYLSYLDRENQETLYEYISANVLSICLKKAEAIKIIGEHQVITEEILNKIFNENKSRPMKAVKIPMKNIRSYFDGMEEGEIIEKILSLINNHKDELA